MGAREFLEFRSGVLKKYDKNPQETANTAPVQYGRQNQQEGGRPSSGISAFLEDRNRILGKYNQEYVDQENKSAKNWADRYNRVMDRVQSYRPGDGDLYLKDIQRLIGDYNGIRGYTDGGLRDYWKNLLELQKDIYDFERERSRFDSEEAYLQHLREEAFRQQLEDSVPWQDQGNLPEEARKQKSNGGYDALQEQIRQEQRDFYGTYSDRFVKSFRDSHSMDYLPEASEPDYSKYLDPDSPYYSAAKRFLDRQGAEYGQWQAEEANNPGIPRAEAEDDSAYQEAIRNANASVREKNRLDYVQKYTGKEFQDNFWGQFGGNYTVGRLSQDSSLAWNEYLENPTEENRRYAQTIDQLASEVQINNPDVFVDEGTLSIISKDLANYLPQLADQIKYEAGGAVAGAAAGFAVAAMTGYAPAIRNGVKAGITAASGAYSYQTMRGAAFKSLLEAGADEETARNAANNEAIISSVIEMGETAIGMALTGGGKAIDAVTGGSAAALKSQVEKIAGKNVATKFMAVLFGYLANIGSEALEEATQESVSIANENDPDAGFLGLAKNAAGTFFDAVTNKDSENRDRVLEAGEGGARLAMIMGGAEIGSNAAVTHIAHGINAKRIYGTDPQALVQEALEVNPDSALAKNLQNKLDSGKKITGSELARLVGENEKTINDRQRNDISTVVEQRLNEVGETGDAKVIATAIAKKVMGEELNVKENKAFNQSSIGAMVLRETESGEVYERVLRNTPLDAASMTRETPGEVNDKDGIRNLAGDTVDAAVSGDGKTRVISTGQDTEIQKIASIRDGNITFQMEDGSLVEAGDIAYGSEGEAIIYDAVASLGVRAEMANLLVDGFTTSGDVPAAVYAKGMQDAFRYGKWGASMRQMESGVFTSQLTELQRQNA